MSSFSSFPIFYPSPYHPIYSSAPLWHLSLILCYSIFFSWYVCVYIPVSPCAHNFSHSHMMLAQIYISSSLPYVFYASPYHSGRISDMHSIWGMSFSILFPYWSSDGNRASRSSLRSLFILICFCVKTFLEGEFIPFFCLFFSCSTFIRKLSAQSMCLWMEVVQSCLFSSSHCHITCSYSQLGEPLSFICSHDL